MAMVEQLHTRVALLIDGDNNSSSSFSSSALLAAAGELGEVTIRRVYGNWSQSSMRGWQDIAHRYGFEQCHHGQIVPGKNATDIALTIDAMDILYSGTIDHFCIVASDSDYRPLLLRLRSAGCKVIGIGKRTAPLALKAACTTFVCLEQLSPVTCSDHSSLEEDLLTSHPPHVLPCPASAIPLDEETQSPSLLMLLTRAYLEVAKQRGEEWIRLSDIGSELKRIHALFRPAQYGYKDLQTLLNAYSAHFEMRRQASKGKPVLVRHKPASLLSSPVLTSPGNAEARMQSEESTQEQAACVTSTPAAMDLDLQTEQQHRDSDLAALLLRAYHLAAEKHAEGWVPIPDLSAALKRLDPEFKATRYGYKNLPVLVRRLSNLFQTRKQTEGVVKHLEIAPVSI